MTWRLLAHPAFTGAVAVLAVNDRLLKHHVPGWWTGKLSDVAGVFVVAVAAAVVIKRPNTAVAATAVGFTALKLVPDVAVLASPVLGGLTRQDPTDLVALAALYPAARLAGAGSPPVGRRTFAHELVVWASGAVAVVSVSATSCVADPAVDAFVVGGDGTAFAHIAAGADTMAPVWAVTRDGGSTWEPAPSPPDAPAARLREACSPRIGCFRLRGGRVEHAVPGRAWRTSFTFTAEQRRRMDRRTDATCGRTDDGFHALALVPRADGEHVVVAMGTQGVLHRSPTGQWERRAVLDRTPVPLHGASVLTRLHLVPVLAVVLSPVLFVIGLRRRSRERAAAGFVAALVGGGAVLVLGLVLQLWGVGDTVTGPLVALLAVVVFAASVLIARAPLVRGGGPVPGCGAPPAAPSNRA